jgi:non-specific serine/threonine protein kinase
VDAEGRREGNLPNELTSFVGRGRELAQVKELLSRTRLLTLVGGGGVGKTRLATRVAARTARAFPGGVWLAELAEIDDAALVPEEIAREVGVTGPPASMLEAVIERLDGPGALLVLDNCEHVLEATAALALELLRACGSLRILATSREPLGVGGEVTLAVPPLAVPGDGETTAEAMSGHAAVQLFVDRAADADPGFTLTDENAPLVAEICRRLDGIPLGLELAAVRVRTLTLDELVDRLDDPLSLANLSLRSAPTRHHTLAATFDWSHELLSEQERVLWRRLSVFAGGFTLATATAVCTDDLLPADVVFDALTGLNERSVVLGEREQPGRHRLLRPVRQYGRELLRQAGEECEFLNRHRSWCSSLGAGPGEPWWTGRDQLRWLEDVRNEHANLCAALEFALGDPNEEVVQAGLQLAGDLWLPWSIDARWTELRGWIDGLLAQSTLPTPERARALLAAGIAARTQGDVEAAERLVAECYELADGKQGYELELGLAVWAVGFAEHASGKLAAARDRFEEAAACFASLDAGVLEAIALFYVAETYGESDLERARALAQESLAVSDARGEVCIRSIVHGRLGVVESLLGDFDAAYEHVKEGLRLQREIGHRWGIAANLEALASVDAAAGEAERAAELLGAADSIWEALEIEEPPLLTGQRHTCEQAARAQLGDERFVALYEQGGARRIDESLALALGEEEASLLADGAGELALLTRRELEVVHLVAAGATNREVAANLVISYQTVKTHLHHILAKLGFESRVELAAWYVRQQQPVS